MPVVVLACESFATEMSSHEFASFWQAIHTDVQKATTRFVYIYFTVDNGWYVVATDDETEYRRLFEKAGLS